MHMMDTEDGLQQKNTLGSSPVSQEHDSDATVGRTVEDRKKMFDVDGKVKLFTCNFRILCIALLSHDRMNEQV